MDNMKGKTLPTVGDTKGLGIDFVVGDSVYRAGTQVFSTLTDFEREILATTSSLDGNNVDFFTWRECNGTKPVSDKVLVDIILVNGRLICGAPSLFFDWSLSGSMRSIEKWRPSMRNWELKGGKPQPKGNPPTLPVFYTEAEYEELFEKYEQEYNDNQMLREKVKRLEGKLSGIVLHMESFQ